MWRKTAPVVQCFSQSGSPQRCANQARPAQFLALERERQFQSKQIAAKEQAPVWADQVAISTYQGEISL